MSVRQRFGSTALVIAALSIVVLAGPARGQVPLPFGNPIEAPRPVVVGSGVDELIGLEGQPEGTWLGTYGTGPYGLSSHLGLTDLEYQVQGQWAAYLWSLVTWITRVLVALMTWAFTVDLFVPLSGVIDGIVGALAISVWQPLIIPTIILAGIWGAWRGIVRREISRLAQGWVWMLAAIATGIFFFTQPSSIANAVNTFTAKVSHSALSAVAAVDPGLCQQGQGKCLTGTAHLAEVTDRLWYLYVVKPYVVMEFGDGDLEEPYLRRLLDAKTVTRDDLVSVGQGRATPEALVEAKAEQYRALAEELRNEGDAFEWFTGKRNYERGMIAGMALVAVLVGGIVLGVIAAGVLLAQLALLLAFLLAPVFLALGIHPGLGRTIALRWGQLSIGMVIKRIGLSILLAILLVVSGSIMTAADSAGGWYTAVILHVLLGIAALLYRKPFLGLLALAAPTAPPLPGVDLRERAATLRTALGLSFAYAIGRQAVMAKSVSFLTSPRKRPPPATPSAASGPGNGGPGNGGAGGPAPGGGGGGGPAGPGSGGRALPGPGGRRPLAGGPATPTGEDGDPGSGGTSSPTTRTGVWTGRSVPGFSLRPGDAPAGDGRATGYPAQTRPEPGSRASEPSRRDLHVPYRRDEQQRIVEPQPNRRRPTPAERMQAQRARDER